MHVNKISHIWQKGKWFIALPVKRDHWLEPWTLGHLIQTKSQVLFCCEREANEHKKSQKQASHKGVYQRDSRTETEEKTFILCFELLKVCDELTVAMVWSLFCLSFWILFFAVLWPVDVHASPVNDDCHSKEALPPCVVVDQAGAALYGLPPALAVQGLHVGFGHHHFGVGDAHAWLVLVLFWPAEESTGMQDMWCQDRVTPLTSLILLVVACFSPPK